MSNMQVPVGQDFAVDGGAPEQPYGLSILVAGANGLVDRVVVRRLVA